MVLFSFNRNANEVEEDMEDKIKASRAVAKKGPSGEKRGGTSSRGKDGSNQKRKRVKTEN